VSKLIISLHKIKESDLPQVGCKALSLARMKKIGLTVPPGFCLTAMAFREHMEANELVGKVESALDKLNSASSEERKSILLEIRQAIINAPLAVNLRNEIENHYQALAANRVAVRSSATAEDLSGHSFAGQYETYLGIADLTGCIKAIKKCWASLWMQRAYDYRQNNGFDHRVVNMAVIVQPMIACKQSGVMFTVNPVSNDRNEILINSSWGLGEAIVSGQVAGDAYIVNKTSKDIKIERIADKDLEIVQLPKEIKHVQVAGDKRMQQCLSQEKIRKLASIGLKLEKHFKCPQDIEWGIVDDDIYIFQTREITTLYKNKDALNNAIKEIKTKTDNPKTVWCDVLLSEMIPSPKPLTWEVLKYGLSREGAFGIYEKEVGLGKVASEGLLVLISGKPYYDLCKLGKMFSFYGLPIRLFDYEKIKKNPSQAITFQPQLDYGKYGKNLILFILKYIALLPYSIYKTLGLAYRLDNLVSDLNIKYTREVLPGYLKYIEELNNRELKQLSEKELVVEIERLIKNWACVTTRDHILSEICLEVPRTLLNYLVGEQQTSILLSGIEGDKLLETNFQLWALARQASPEVADIILNDKPGQIVSTLLKSESGQGYLAQVRQFLKTYGHRTSDEYELSTPRWSEEPAKVFEMIRHYLKSKEADPIDHFEKQKITRTELEQKIIEDYSIGIHKLIPVAKKLFIFALKFSQLYSVLRETTKFYHLMEYAQLRRFLVELGMRFSHKEKSGIKDKDDIFFLLPKELPLIVQNELNYVQVRQLVSKRKHDYQMNLSIQLPPVIFYDSLDKLGEHVEITASDVLKGTPVSGGRVEGKVRIILDPSEFGKFQEGEILVAHRTDVGWTPLFFTAKALVMDIGNVLSHGAIIAREYGLPTVVNVKDASTILKDGQKIVVDGEEGKVYISKIGETKL